MHRTLEVTVVPEATEELASLLTGQEDVVGLSVHKGASRKPPGDTLTVQVLNRGADEALRTIARMDRYGDVSIVTAETASIIAPSDEKKVSNDVDEAIWEEMKAGLRQQGHVTQNFLILMALGGVLATVGLVSKPAPQAIAFVAAACITPGFEPFTAIALSLFFRRWDSVRRAATSVVVGYGVLIAASALTFWVLHALDATSPQKLIENPEVTNIASPGAKEVIVSLCGAASGVVILSAYRRSVIVGALIALVMIPAAALVGAALVAGQRGLAWEGLKRVGLDAAFIIGLGLLVFWLKQLIVHRRKPMV